MKHVAPEVFTPVMTKREKLERWADIISQYEDDVMMLDRLEYWEEPKLNRSLSETSYYTPSETKLYRNTAFQIAADDPDFKAMGLIDTVASAMNFFDVSQHELHEFSCNCGGRLHSGVIAFRIRNIADPTWMGWFKNLWR